MVSITSEEIALLSKYVNEITGIKLDPEKGYLLESRFQPLINEYKCSNYRDLYQKAKNDQSGSVMNQMIDAITTNETYFFRDSKPFDLLSNKIIPDLIDRRRQEAGSQQISLKIWSAACSTGQEIYSIGITLSEMLKNIDQYHISILGTDISDDVIAKASYGQYNRFEVERGLPPHFLNKYFTKTANGWRIKDKIRTMARFEKIDLTKQFLNLGRFDIIFCRNVAIYFDNRDKVTLFNKIGQSLLPGGSLIVGASESLSGVTDEFVARHYLKSMYYQLRKDSPVPVKPRKTTPAAKPAIPLSPRTDRKSRPETKPAPTVRQPVKPSRPAPSRSNPPVASQPAPTPVPPPITKKQTPVQGSSLLAGLEKTRGNKSLLSRIKNNQSVKKKSLLDDIRED